MTRKYTRRVQPVTTILDKVKLPVEELNNDNNCEYRLTMQFNGEVFDCFTNNLKISMLSFRPQQLYTDGYVKIQKGEAMFERRYNLIDLRQLMTNEERLDVFVANLQLG